MIVWIVNRLLSSKIDGQMVTVVLGVFSSEEKAFRFTKAQDASPELRSAASRMGGHVQHTVRPSVLDQLDIEQG